jgi:hypothetical protein
MPIPTLTTTQQFQNSVNGIINTLSMLFGNNPQSLPAVYINRIYNPIFTNENGTPAQAIANLGTSAGSVFSSMVALSSLLVGIGITGIPAIPPYTANQDGTVILTAPTT